MKQWLWLTRGHYSDFADRASESGRVRRYGRWPSGLCGSRLNSTLSRERLHGTTAFIVPDPARLPTTGLTSSLGRRR